MYRSVANMVVNKRLYLVLVVVVCCLVSILPSCLPFAFSCQEYLHLFSLPPSFSNMLLLGLNFVLQNRFSCLKLSKNFPWILEIGNSLKSALNYTPYVRNMPKCALFPYMHPCQVGKNLPICQRASIMFFLCACLQKLKCQNASFNQDSTVSTYDQNDFSYQD